MILLPIHHFLFLLSHTHTLSIWYCRNIYVHVHLICEICMWDIHTINDISIICEIDIYITNLPTQFIPNRNGTPVSLVLGLYKYLLFVMCAVYWLSDLPFVPSQIPQHCHLWAVQSLALSQLLLLPNKPTQTPVSHCLAGQPVAGLGMLGHSPQLFAVHPG